MQINITKIVVVRHNDNGLSRVWLHTNLPNILNLGEEYIKIYPYSLFGVIPSQDVYKQLETTFKDVPVEVVEFDKEKPTYGMWNIKIEYSLNPEYSYGKLTPPTKRTLMYV